MSQDEPLQKIPKVEESTLVYDEFFKIRKDSLVLPNNQKYNYYTLVTPQHAVNVLGITDDEELVLLEEYRHPIRNYILGSPGGYLDNQESPLAAAERELLEETGFSAREFIMLGSAYPYPGISAQKIFFVLGKGAYKKEEAKPESSEIFRTAQKTEKELREYIQEGKPVDGILCSALYFWNTWKASY